MNYIEFHNNMNEHEKQLLIEIFKSDIIEIGLNDFIKLYKNHNELSKYLKEKIKSLPEISSSVIKLYFGIGDANKYHSILSISDQLNYTENMVRQIRHKALLRLGYEIIIDHEIFNNSLIDELLTCTINILRLPVMIYDILYRKDIKIIQDIINLNAYDLMLIKNLESHDIMILLKNMHNIGFNNWVAKIYLELDDAITIKNTYMIYQKASVYKYTCDFDSIPIINHELISEINSSNMEDRSKCYKNLTKTKDIISNKISWKCVFNSQNIWPADYAKCRESAKNAKYEYLSFNGNIYTVNDLYMSDPICNDSEL